MRVGEEVAADLNAGIKTDVRQDGGVRADVDMRPNNGVCADVRVGANDGCRIDDGRGMNSGPIRRRLMEEAERAREGVVGVLDAQRCGGDFLELGLDENCGGVRVAGERGVLNVRNESDLGWARLFQCP